MLLSEDIYTIAGKFPEKKNLIYLYKCVGLQTQ